MEEREFVELRSEEVQEILGTPPSWLVRWGTFLICVCVAALLGVAAMISYPDVVDAKVVITTTTPPVDIVARADGYITRFLVRDQAPVRQGQILAVLQSTANYDHVLRLDEKVNAWQQYNSDSLKEIRVLYNLDLGEIQASYSAFVQDVANYRFSIQDKSSTVRQNLGSFDRQIDRMEKSIGLDQKSMRRVEEQLKTARELYQKQKELFDGGLISRIDLERERQKVDDLERQYDALEESVFRKQNEIISLRKNRNQESFSEREDESTAGSRLRQSLNNLRASLDQWKQTYLLTAPIGGRVALNSTFFSEKQFVKQGEQLMTIVPPQSGRIIGRLFLPIAGSGKVKQGQKVIVKLDSYPYYEFGTLEGMVVSKSLVPKDNKYAIVAAFGEELKTSYNKPIPFEQQLQGQAAIITEDKQFLQRIYEQVFAARR